MATKRTKAILTLGGIFIVGALCGALAVGAFVRSEVRSTQRLRDRSGFHEYFADQLELTTAQRDSLQGELDWFYGELAGLRAAAAGDLHDLLDTLDRRLITRLSPEQVARLRATETRMRGNLATERPAPLDGSVDGVERVERETADRATPRTDTLSPQTSTKASSTPKVTSTPAAPLSDTTSALDSAGGAPDEAMTGLRDRLRERLGLSDEQSVRIREIILSARRQIRRDLVARRGYPRMQLEIASRHLREMDRRILEQLDARQTIAYEPIREDMAKRIREKIARQWKKHPKRRINGGTSTPDTTAR